MAKKKQQEEISAIDIDATLEVNIIGGQSNNYSVFAFGSDLINWKNYINSDIDKMKKDFYPKIGSTITDREGKRYKISNIRLSEWQDKETTMKYIIDIELL